MQIDVILGNIVTCSAEVIVNAANETLLGGGGVDGAIHDAAGPGLLEECRAIGGCPTGEVRVTGAHSLPFKAIIHAVGPIWRGGNKDEAAQLARCYSSALTAASELDAESIAFPAISTGAFAFPDELAAQIAIETCRSWSQILPARVLLMAFDHHSQNVLAEALREARNAP